MSHFRSNVKEHLKGLDEPNKSTITNQIFGYHNGDEIYNEGMVDAYSPEMFDSLSESVRQDWEKKCPTFVRWFDTTTSLIKQEMLANVRTSAGLGLRRHNSKPSIMSISCAFAFRRHGQPSIMSISRVWLVTSQRKAQAS